MNELVRNIPSIEGAEGGSQLARLTEKATNELRLKFPNLKLPCGTCAFRRGTFPNRCAATVMDAFKCVMEQEDFYCHESDGKVGLCHGWMICLSAVSDKPPIKVPWDYSLTDEEKLVVDAER